MRVLTVASLFPSRVSPSHGIFVFRREQALRARGAEVRVLAPVPWVPPGPVPARYARLRAVPSAEEIGGLHVRHPRYLMIPKVGMYVQDRTYARGLLATVREEVERFRPDLLAVHYLYPDACAVARIARVLNLPFVASARGSDVKRLGRIPHIAKRIRGALKQASGVIAVSQDLADTMRSLGLYAGDVRVIPNGVDPALFRPRDRADARRALGLPVAGRRVVCVGHLDEVHGQELLLEALAHHDAPSDVVLDLVGGGPQAPLRRRAGELELAGRVNFVGAVAPEQVPLWFAAANASAHPGLWAGCPNAVLESLACGTPCLASDLPEMREALPSRTEGILVRRDPSAFARGLMMLLAAFAGNPRPPRTWDDVAGEVLAFYRSASVAHPRTPRPMPVRGS